MSYAIETKKRKFDRLLESLTEGSSQPQQQPRSGDASISKAPSRIDFSIGSKKRRVTPTTNHSDAKNSLVNHYLPSSRAAFLERLETYRHITKWHIPSTIIINAAEWAKRGWICVDVDTVCCGSCSERLTIDLTVNKATDEEEENAREQAEDTCEVQKNDDDDDSLEVEIYERLIERYSQMITTSHSESCSWRKRGCDASIQRIEGLLNTANTVAAVRTRFMGIIEGIGDVPPVSDLPAHHDLPAPKISDLEELSFTPTNLDAIRLALCGWQYKEADVVDCKNCFRSLGLWLYRGSTPTVEHLDPVDSHLEYCPWRSAEAQHTELMIHPDTPNNGGRKMEFPGWALDYHAIKKHNLKKNHGADQSMLAVPQIDGVDGPREAQSPEQRDKKMQDLKRRIKEISKPFKVKSFLKKKDVSER